MPATNHNPLVTVAMVTYNQENLVGMAIESVLSSSYSNFELIVSDDCSSDKTWEIITSYNDPRIRAYRNEPNLGEYPNRNRCISLAKGKYLIFIDGDDVIYPHGLEFMIKMLNAFPDCGMALMRWFKNNIIYPAKITPEQFYIGEYFGNGFLGTSFANTLFDTEILKKEGGLDPLYEAGDDLIRYKIAQKHNVLLINDNLTWWRETPNQAFQRLQHRFDFVLKSINLQLAFLKSTDCPLAADDKQLACRNIKITYLKVLVKKLLRLKFKEALALKTTIGFKFHDLVLINKKILIQDPFKDFTPLNPYYIKFNENPFSANYKIHE